MGIWRWPNLLLVGIACWFAIGYEAVAPGWTNHGSRAFGDLSITLRTRGRIEPGAPFEAMLEANGAASVVLRVRARPRDRASSVPLDEQWNAQWNVQLSGGQGEILEVMAPKEADAPMVLVVTGDRSGESARWNLGRLYD